MTFKMTFNSDAAAASVVRLNIGGKKFCTTIDTLSQREPDSMLAAMFSGRHTVCQDSEGYVFVDRDGQHFRHILNWLRDGVIPSMTESEYSELLREAEYFQLLRLMDEIKASLIKRKEEDEMGSELTRSDIVKCTQSEKGADQGAKIGINPSSGSSTISHSTFPAATTASTGNGIFKFGSSFVNSTGNSLQSSMFAGATKSPIFGAKTVTKGKPAELFSSASAPALNMNTGASLGSLPSRSVPFFHSSSSTTTSLFPAGGVTSSSFKSGASPTAVSEGSAVSSSASIAPIRFGLRSSSSLTSTVFPSSGPSIPVFSSGGTSISAFHSGISGLFGSGGSSSASNLVNSSSAPTPNIFGSGFQSPKFSTFGSLFASASTSSGFSYSCSTNVGATMLFNPSTGASSSPLSSFTAASASAISSHSQPSPYPQPVFGNPLTGGGFVTSPGNNDQMNAEDTMAEDPVPSSAPIVPPVFGQLSPSPSPYPFTFPTQNDPFLFNGQQSQSPSAASSRLEFGAGGFLLGSTKSGPGPKFMKIKRIKNRNR